MKVMECQRFLLKTSIKGDNSNKKGEAKQGTLITNGSLMTIESIGHSAILLTSIKR